MSEHVTTEEMKSYARGSLTPGAMLRVDDHVSSCESCRSRMSAGANVEELAEQWRSELKGSAGAHSRWWLAVAAAAVLIVATAIAIVFRTPQTNEVARLQDGAAIIRLYEKGRLDGVTALSEPQKERLREALQGKLTIAAAAAELVGQREQLMGERGASVVQPLRYPLGTAIAEARPVFRWVEIEGAKSFEVLVQDEESGEIVRSPALTSREWQSGEPLRRGRTYRWQLRVTGSKDQVIFPKPPAPQARFLIIGEAAANDLSALPDSHALRGVLYAEAGLLDAAAAEFDALLEQNSESAPVKSWIEAIRKIKTPW